METTFSLGWVVWMICAKGIDAQNVLLYGITVWRLKK
jgi:hypothetical protein